MFVYSVKTSKAKMIIIAAVIVAAAGVLVFFGGRGRGAETAQDGAKRYDFVWASAGENGDQLGRAVILDDGNYHYCLSVLRDADTTEKSQIVWRDVFDSFKLI